MYQELSHLLIVSKLLNIIQCYIGVNEQKQKMQELTLPFYILYILTALYFHFLIQIFCTLFICLIFNGLLQLFFFFVFFFNVLFRVIDYFGKTYLLLSCWFHCVDIFYIKFIFFETFTETYSVTKLLLIETLSNFRNIKCSSTLNLYMYVLL